MLENRVPSCAENRGERKKESARRGRRSDRYLQKARVGRGGAGTRA